MPEQVDKVFRSPDFFFSNGTWYLKIYPYGQTKHNSEGWIGVYLVKKNSFTSEHFVIYTLGIKKVNGTDYDSFTFEDNFGKNGTGIGTPKFMTKYALVENRDLIAPDGTMTFFCNLLEKDFPKQTVENIEDEVAKVPLEGFEKLQKDLESLMKEQDGDIIFKFKDMQIKAHMPILRVRSPFFEKIYRQNKRQPSYFFEQDCDYDPEAVRYLLSHLYCGKLDDFSKTSVFNLLHAANKFEVDEVQKKCVKIILDNLDMDTIFDALDFTGKCNDPRIMQPVKEFVLQHAPEIFTTNGWGLFLNKYPEQANDIYIEVYKEKSCK